MMRFPYRRGTGDISNSFLPTVARAATKPGRHVERAGFIRHSSFVLRHSGSFCLCLLLASFLFTARSQAGADPLSALVQVLRETRDPQLQLDVLKGLSAAFK